jgi:hypothetical protein
MIPRTVPAFDRKYSNAQADAIASAWNDRGMRPAKRVQELARAGELTDPTARRRSPGLRSQRARSARSRATRRRRRRGEIRSPLSEAGPRDAIEIMRRRMANMIDGEMAVEERKRPGTRDAERLRQLNRALLELARLPGPTDPRPPPLPAKDAEGKRTWRRIRWTRRAR